LSFDFPFQNRSARGKQGLAEAKARQIDIRLGFLRDQVTAEVHDALSAVRASHERLKLLGDEVRVSRELEEAERTRFELGEGTLFVLNLREQATLDAAIREALAQADYQRARAAYDYATGTLLYR
jgi:cobalt-zinc-cadmium efflux system outer membrane protein